MVIAYHLIWTLYGWWLPNDPRGSSSRVLRNDLLSEMGKLHFGRKRIQPASQVIRDFYEEAQSVLKHQLLTLTTDDVPVVADSFEQTIQQQQYTCYACAIMPDHIHLILRKHRDQAEQMIENFQTASRNLLHLHDSFKHGHPVWGGQGWKVFLDSPEDIKRTIKYVFDNRRKARLPDQNCIFVTPYDNWPFHKKQFKK